MRESISYAFLLNIVIIFMFLCATIIVGIFSYYRAFRANSIIVSEIEKYEGYNCLSKEAIAKKLSIIAYNVPFNVKCKSDDINCVVDDTKNYAVVSYNLDYNTGSYAFKDKMNANYSKDGDYTRLYQYGVYTYMYVDMPIISSLLKIPFYSRTSVLYEFRNLKYAKYKGEGIKYDGVFNYDFIPSDVKDVVDSANSGLDQASLNALYITEYSVRILSNYTQSLAQKDFKYYYKLEDYGYGRSSTKVFNIIDAYLYSDTDIGSAQRFLTQGRYSCGHKFDWSMY